MKNIIVIILLVVSFNVNAQVEVDEMAKIISTFNSVMDSYNLEYTSAKSDLEILAVDKKYESIISKAESVMEKDQESVIQKQNEALAKEHKESENETFEDDKEDGLDDVENVVLDEKLELRASKIVGYHVSGMDDKTIAKKFKKSDLAEVLDYLKINYVTSWYRHKMVSAIIEAKRK